MRKPPSHPVTTVLLIVSAIALLVAIGIQGTQLGQHRSEAEQQLSEYTVTPTDY